MIVWFGLVRFGSVRFGSAWFGLFFGGLVGWFSWFDGLFVWLFGWLVGWLVAWRSKPEGEGMRRKYCEDRGGVVPKGPPREGFHPLAGHSLATVSRNRA